jgi:hypothetical protein
VLPEDHAEVHVEGLEERGNPAHHTIDEQHEVIEERPECGGCPQEGTALRVAERLQGPIPLPITQPAMVVAWEWRGEGIVGTTTRMMVLDRRSPVPDGLVLVAPDLGMRSGENQRIRLGTVETARCPRAETTIGSFHAFELSRVGASHCSVLVTR